MEIPDSPCVHRGASTTQEVQGRANTPVSCGNPCLPCVASYICYTTQNIHSLFTEAD
ncbi:hypothetical protein ACOMHN_039092 [Nucella lapillus]